MHNATKNANLRNAWYQITTYLKGFCFNMHWRGVENSEETDNVFDLFFRNLWSSVNLSQLIPNTKRA